MRYAIVIGDVVSVVLPSSGLWPSVEPIDDAPDSSILFYDLIDGSGGQLCGLELHVNDDGALAHALAGHSYVTFEPFPRIWFIEDRVGCARGLEAFGGIKVFENEDGVWYVIVSSDWLTEGDEEQLRRYAALSQERRS